MWVTRILCFSPLRYWGGLYLSSWRVGTTEGFSPLRYWGGLYQILTVEQGLRYVLVPFDIGVVYITSLYFFNFLFSFSPLRYWGGLYRYGKCYRDIIIVLVPFDIGVVYIIWKNSIGRKNLF